jgi:hypothetical protein
MPRFVLIDHSLIDYSGHHCEYAQSALAAAAAAGFQSILAANRRFSVKGELPWPIYPAYKYGVWFHQGAPRWQQFLRRAAVSVARAAQRRYLEESDLDVAGRRTGAGAMRSWARQRRLRRFLRDSCHFFDRIRTAPDDVIFWPTRSFDEFLQLDRARRRGALPRQGEWHVVFRRDVAMDSPVAVRAIKMASEPIEASVSRNAWHFWTDTEELATQYQHATGRQFGVLPIPHADMTAAAAEAERFRILYLGDARREKGFHHLPRVVEQLADCAPHRFEFCFQSHLAIPGGEPEVVAARKQLARMTGRGVRLLNEPLDSAAYRSLLTSGHLNLLLYNSQAYAARSSGVFAESRAAGIPTLVPENTWMARQLPPDAGLVCRDANEAASQIQCIEADYGRFAAGARAHAARWRQQHNASRLIALLADRSARQPPVYERSSGGISTLD